MNRALIAISLAVSFAFAAPVPKALKKNNDAVSILGVWDDKNPGGQIWFFNSDGTGGAGEPTKSSCPAIYKIDPTQSPKQLDWSQDGGKTWNLSVYELDGDALKINFGVGGTGIRPEKVAPPSQCVFMSGTRRSEANK